MLNKKFSKVGIGLLACVMAALFVWVNISPAQPVALDEVTIHSDLWTADKYEDSKLTHKKHVEEYKIPCASCHHVYKDGKNVWKEGDEVQKCDACHTCVKTGKALKDASPEEKKLSLYNAFHDNCKGCHKDYNTKNNTKDAPTKCTDCHAKKK